MLGKTYGVEKLKGDEPKQILLSLQKKKYTKD